MKMKIPVVLAHPPMYNCIFWISYSCIRPILSPPPMGMTASHPSVVPEGYPNVNFLPFPEPEFPEYGFPANSGFNIPYPTYPPADGGYTASAGFAPPVDASGLAPPGGPSFYPAGEGYAATTTTTIDPAYSYGADGYPVPMGMPGGPGYAPSCAPPMGYPSGNFFPTMGEMPPTFSSGPASPGGYAAYSQVCSSIDIFNSSRVKYHLTRWAIQFTRKRKHLKSCCLALEVTSPDTTLTSLRIRCRRQRRKSSSGLGRRSGGCVVGGTVVINLNLKITKSQNTITQNQIES